MDLETLREVTDRWVDAGIVDPETAEEIRTFEADRKSTGTTPGAGAVGVGDENRLVVALSLMGAVLVGAGLFFYLVANWTDIPTAIRTAILVVTPIVAGGAGIALAQGRAPKVGHGCWFLGAAFLGPSVFLLADLHASGIGVEWLFLAWALGALPAGHAFDSRPTTALGLFAALAAVVTVADATTGLLPFVVAFVAAVIVAAGLLVRTRTERLGGVYRLVGFAVPIGALLLLGFQDGSYPRVAVGPEPAFLASGLAALACLAFVGEGFRREQVSTPDAVSVGSVVAAAALATAIVAVTPPLPAVASFLAVHAVLLGLLVAFVWVGVETGSTATVNLVALAFFLQVISFLATTVADAFSGPIALVVAGLVLLAVGLALERGRRIAVSRIG